MRLAFFTRVFPPQQGGMERFAQQLCDYLTAQGHSVTVVGVDESVAKAARNSSYEVVALTNRPRMLQVLRAVDVVHLNGNTVKGLSVVPLGKATVMTHHGHQALCPSGMCWSPVGQCTVQDGRIGPCARCEVTGWKARVSTLLHRGAAYVPAHNVCVSGYLRERLQLPNARVIYNPLAPDFLATRSTAPATSRHTLAFAGRMVAEKGLVPLLHAMAGLVDTFLEIAGGGPELGEAQAVASTLGLEKRVRFHGVLGLEALKELYLGASLVVVPTQCPETFGYAVAEPMALGRPVLTTPFGAQKELVEEGRGFLAPDGSAQGLQRGIQAALENETELRNRSKVGAAFARSQLSVELVGARYEECYRACAAA